jgi:cytochrome c-type biogenesis protein CcmH/NrfF
MRVPRRSSFWIKTAEVIVLAVMVSFSMGASSAAARFNELGGKLMCTCGCAQLLGGCDHVGCPSRGQEMADLQAQITAGKTDQEILNWFAAKYGATVLAAPPARGFDLIAWIAPFAVFAAALLGTILLIRHWGSLPGGKMEPVAVSNPADMDPAQRARFEQIRRETGSDGGF